MDQVSFSLINYNLLQYVEYSILRKIAYSTSTDSIVDRKNRKN